LDERNIGDGHQMSPFPVLAGRLTHGLGQERLKNLNTLHFIPILDCRTITLTIVPKKDREIQKVDTPGPPVPGSTLVPDHFFAHCDFLLFRDICGCDSQNIEMCTI
jgi:hypothetical protein